MLPLGYDILVYGIDIYHMKGISHISTVRYCTDKKIPANARKLIDCGK